MSTIAKERDSSKTLEIAVMDRPHAWALEIQDDTGSRRIPLTDAKTVLGSGPESDVILADPTVSQRHAGLEVTAGGVMVTDLQSRNGTFVGGARVHEARAAAGTTVLIGRSTFTLHAVRGEESDQEEGEPLDGIAGGSFAMRRVAARVRRYATNPLPVLVTGETGTGKELIARSLHQEGPRANGPFVALNVASLPRDLVESEFFGHERGAFTGAVSKRLGALMEAEGGTLFLDEIGDMPLDAQPKLLRALDGYEVRRVGATGRGKAPDVRIIAATNKTLSESVAKGEFRRDLYHRLSVFTVTLPPLRERRGDIGPIARAILAAAPREIEIRSLTPRALARLLTHDWTGNVRELKSILYRASDEARRSRAIDLEHVEDALRAGATPPYVALQPDQAQVLLERHRGNVTAAARAAGMPRSTFRKRLRAAGLREAV